jgi:hypothetical protein
VVGRISFARVALLALYAATFAAALWLFSRGSSFYLTPLAERAHHDGYWLWKPGGRYGHTLGIVGSTLMVLMLSYSLRKRVSALRRLGPLSRWLDVHIYFGVAGPLLVVLHSSLKVQGLVALSFWSMVAVALSGVLGRYLYLQIPRTRAGDEIALDELLRRDRVLSERLQRLLHVDASRLAALDNAAGLAGGRPTLWRLLRDMLFGAAHERGEVRRFVREHGHALPASLARELEALAREKAATRRRILIWDRTHELFHYWHVLHKPFAVVMYLFMAVHIVVAYMTGYGRVSLP